MRATMVDLEFPKNKHFMVGIKVSRKHTMIVTLTIYQQTPFITKHDIYNFTAKHDIYCYEYKTTHKYFLMVWFIHDRKFFL